MYYLKSLKLLRLSEKIVFEHWTMNTRRVSSRVHCNQNNIRRDIHVVLRTTENLFVECLNSIFGALGSFFTAFQLTSKDFLVFFYFCIFVIAISVLIVCGSALSGEPLYRLITIVLVLFFVFLVFMFLAPSRFSHLSVSKWKVKKIIELISELNIETIYELDFHRVRMVEFKQRVEKRTRFYYAVLTAFSGVTLYLLRKSILIEGSNPTIKRYLDCIVNFVRSDCGYLLPSTLFFFMVVIMHERTNRYLFKTILNAIEETKMRISILNDEGSVERKESGTVID
jgi:hypothetical protein